MPRWLSIAAVWIVALVLSAALDATAQPVTTGGRFRLPTTCASANGLRWNGSAWLCDAFTTYNAAMTFNADVTIGNSDSDTLSIAAKLNTHLSTTGTTPSLSGCGSSLASIAGNDTAGVVSQGNGSVTTCRVTFANNFTTNAPVCVVTGKERAVTITAVTTTYIEFSTVTPTDDNKQVFYYHCVGRL